MADEDDVDAAEEKEIPETEIDDIEDAEKNTDDTPTDDNGEAKE